MKVNLVKDSKKPYTNDAIDSLKKNHLNAHCINKAGHARVEIVDGNFRYHCGRELANIAIRVMREYRIGVECSDGVFMAYDSRSPLDVSTVAGTPVVAILKTFLKMDITNFRLHSKQEMQKLYSDYVKEYGAHG